MNHLRHNIDLKKLSTWILCLIIDKFWGQLVWHDLSTAALYNGNHPPKRAHNSNHPPKYVSTKPLCNRNHLSKSSRPSGGFLGDGAGSAGYESTETIKGNISPSFLFFPSFKLAQNGPIWYQKCNFCAENSFFGSTSQQRWFHHDLPSIIPTFDLKICSFYATPITITTMFWAQGDSTQ